LAELFQTVAAFLR